MEAVVVAAARGGADPRLFLLLKLMLPLAAANCAAAFGRGTAAGGTVVLTVCASLLGCHCYSYVSCTLFFSFRLVFGFAALPHIPTSLVKFGGVACRIFLPLAQTLLNLGGKAIHLF